MLETERETYRTFLATQGLRLTRERTALFEEIFHHHKHFDAEELLALMRKKGHKISRATIYRSLDLMVKAGLVSRQRLDGVQNRYEHQHPGEHHDHMVCLHCGKIIEFQNREIERLQDEICQRLGFHPRAHTHRIEGCCRDCFAPEGAGPSASRRSHVER